MAFYLFSGLDYLTRDRAANVRYGVAGLALVLLVATYVPRYTTLSFNRIPHDVMSAASMEFYDYLRSSQDAEGGVLTRLPREVALFSDRTATPARHTSNNAERYTDAELDLILDRAEDMGVKMIAAGPRGFGFHVEILPLWNMLDDYPELFEPLWSNDEWRVVRIK